ncbi:MAG TPA: tetratricopeptide repeat protein [Candidatus Deferrimicrobium sp.]|nr:tetratricopeptide repeat protein [Candidatus Deferrimicrobium sp.]
MSPEEWIYEVTFPIFGKIVIERPFKLNEYEFFRQQGEYYLKINDFVSDPLEVHSKAHQKANEFLDFIAYLTRTGLSLGFPRILRIDKDAPRVQIQSRGSRLEFEYLEPFIANFFPKFENIKGHFDQKFIDALRWFRIGCISEGVDSYLAFFIAFEMIVSDKIIESAEHTWTKNFIKKLTKLPEIEDYDTFKELKKKLVSVIKQESGSKEKTFLNEFLKLLNHFPLRALLDPQLLKDQRERVLSSYSYKEKGLVRAAIDYYNKLKIKFQDLGYSEENFIDFFKLFLYDDFKKEIEILYALRNKIVHSGLRKEVIEHRQTFELQYKNGKKVRISLGDQIKKLRQLLIGLINFHFKELIFNLKDGFPNLGDLIGYRDIGYDKFLRIKEKFPELGYDELKILCYPFLHPFEGIDEIYRWLDYDRNEILREIDTLEDFDAKIGVLDKSLIYNSYDLKFLKKKIELLRGNKDRKPDAIALIDGIRRFPNLKERERNDFLEKKADILFELGAYKDAKEIYYQLDNSNEPYKINYKFKLGVCHYHLNEFDISLDYFKEVASLLYDHFKSRLYIAHIYTRQEHHEEAEPFAEVALELQPSNKIALLLNAEVKVKLGKYQEADVLLSRIPDSEKDAPYYYVTALKYASQNLTGEAINNLREVIALDPACKEKILKEPVFNKLSEVKEFRELLLDS